MIVISLYRKVFKLLYFALKVGLLLLNYVKEQITQPQESKIIKLLVKRNWYNNSKFTGLFMSNIISYS